MREEYLVEDFNEQNGFEDVGELDRDDLMALALNYIQSASVDTLAEIVQICRFDLYGADLEDFE